MRFVVVILPLLAVLAKSASVLCSAARPTPTFTPKYFTIYDVTPEDRAEIQIKFDNLKHAFAKQGIDPTDLYCADCWNEGLVRQIAKNRRLFRKFRDFLYLVYKYSFFADEFFCKDLMKTLNAMA